MTLSRHKALPKLSRAFSIGPMRRVPQWEKWLCAVALVMVIVVPLLSRRSPPNFTDWQVYVEAGTKMAQGHTVYDVAGHYQYKYAPIVAGVFATLLQVFSGTTLGWINWGLELALFVALFFYFGGVSALRLRPWKYFVVLLLGVACLAINLRDELKLGQLNLWCLWLLLSAWLLAGRRRLRWAALLWVVAVSLKLYALILAPYWVFKREWKLLGWSMVAYFGLSILWLVPWVGFSGALSENLAWLKTLSSSSAELSGSTYDVSLIGSLIKLGLPQLLAFAIWGLALITFLWESWQAARRPSADPLRFLGRSFAWILLLNPLVWPYWYLFLAVIFFASLAEPSRFSGRVLLPRFAWWILVISLLIAMHRSSTPAGVSGMLAGLLGIFLMVRPKSHSLAA